MGKGLKDQWGVKDPAKAGSDKQAQEFDAKFKAEIATINKHLQYTSANAPEAQHAPLEGRRDALYQAFQAAKAQIDKTDPNKAKGAIDRVLADGKALCTEAAKLHAETEKAKKEWLARQPKFDGAVHQTEELEAWGDAKAPALRTLVDAIRTKVNERNYAPASATVDQLLPKLKPIYDDYVKQKAAKPKYEQAHGEQSARLEQLKTAEKPSQPMATKSAEADTVMQAAAAKADAKDFVAAEEILKKEAKPAIDALDKLTKDPARAQFLSESKAADEILNAPADVTFKSQEADWNAIVQERQAAEAAASAGDYAGANTTLADLKQKHAAWKAKNEELKQQKEAYESVATPLTEQLKSVEKAADYPKLATPYGEITKAKGEMEAAAAAEDFVKATSTAIDLKAKVDALAPDLQKIQKAEEDFKAAWGPVEPKLKDALVTANSFKSLEAQRKALETGQRDITTAVEAKDFEKALPLAQALGPKVDEYLAKAKEEEDKVKAKANEITKKLDDANYFTRDGVAREAANSLTEDELKGLPPEVRNRLLEELQSGYMSDDDKAACKKLFSVKSLDPQFEKMDDANRQKLIDKLKNDPTYKDARANWGTMTDDQRVAVLKKVADAQAEAYGIPPTKVESYSPKNPDGTPRTNLYGEYSHSEGVLKVSSDMMKNVGFDSAMDTVVHENAHRLQAVMVDDLDAGKIKPGDPRYNQAKTFKLNDTQRGFYVRPPDEKPPEDAGNEYFTQPQEDHSRRTGEDVAAAKIGK